MSETSREPVKVPPFLVRHFVWIAIGSLLLLAVGGVLVVWMPYQREQRIARMIQADGGGVGFRYCGPDWIPESVVDRLPFIKRITGVYGMRPPGVSAETLLELGSLTHLESLELMHTFVTDASLVHLNELTYLEALWLNDTPVTDAGLVHLKGQTSLGALFLNDTHVTDAGLVHLKGLSNLKVLCLTDTPVTNAGLVHLKELTSLYKLDLHNTQVTAEGRAMLRKALPSCKIEPSP